MRATVTPGIEYNFSPNLSRVVLEQGKGIVTIYEKLGWKIPCGS